MADNANVTSIMSLDQFALYANLGTPKPGEKLNSPAFKISVTSKSNCSLAVFLNSAQENARIHMSIPLLTFTSLLKTISSAVSKGESGRFTINRTAKGYNNGPDINVDFFCEITPEAVVIGLAERGKKTVHFNVASNSNILKIYKQSPGTSEPIEVVPDVKEYVLEYLSNLGLSLWEGSRLTNLNSMRKYSNDETSDSGTYNSNSSSGHI